MKALRIISMVLLTLVGLNALVAGFLFITDPSGAAMGMSVKYLQHSPFSNYFIPGIILFITQGITALFAAVFVLRRLAGSGLMTVMQGALLTGWIVIQVLMVRDFNPLQATMLLSGLLLMLTGGILHQRRTR